MSGAESAQKAMDGKIHNKQDERERVQKKTFTKWVNKHLMKVKRRVDDLYVDLRDGHNLLCLLEVLSGEKLPREKGKMLVHMLQNVNIALEFLRKKQVKLVNIRSEEITQGSPKLTLGLIWTLILHFQVSEIEVGEQHRDLTAQSRLLMWVRGAIDGYPSLRCDNFSTSWRDGKVFNAIIHKHRPDLVNIEKVYVSTNVENLERAFTTAEEHFEVVRLLDPEDVDVPNPDEKSIVTYVSSLYDAFPKIPAGGIGLQDVDARWEQYQFWVSELLAWIAQQAARIASGASHPAGGEQRKALLAWFSELRNTEMVAKAEDKARIHELHKALEVWINFGRIQVPPELSPAHVDAEWDKLAMLLDAQQRSVATLSQRSEQQARADSERRLASLDQLLATIARAQAEVDGAEWGRDEAGVTVAMAAVSALQHQLLQLGASVEEAASARETLLVEHQAQYDTRLQQVNLAFAHLKSSWEARVLHLRSLLALAETAREPLAWMARAEAAELTYDWSRTDGLQAKGDSLSALRRELSRVEGQVARIVESAQSLLQAGHPARDSIKAISGDLEARLLWIQTLAACSETQLRENTAYVQFFDGVRDTEEAILVARRRLADRCSWKRSADRIQLQTILEEIQEEEDSVLEGLRSKAQALVSAAASVADVSPSDAAAPGGKRLALRALCDIPAHGETVVSQGARCELLGPASRPGWRRVGGPSGPAEAPAVCLATEPPSDEALRAASRLRELLAETSLERQATVRGLVAWQSLLQVVDETRAVSDQELLALQQEELVSAVETVGTMLASFDEQSTGGVLVWRDRAAGEAEAAAERYRAALQRQRNAAEEGKRAASALRGLAERLGRCRATMERGLGPVAGGVPDLPEFLRQGLAKHRVTEKELASVGEELPRVATAMEASPPGSPGGALAGELLHVRGEHQLLLNASSLYGTRLQALELLLVNLRKAQEAASGLEGRLGDGGPAPCKAASLEQLRSRLAEMQEEAAQAEALVLRPLRSSLGDAEAASGPLLEALPGPGADGPLGLCRGAVEELLSRWDGATQQLTVRLGDATALAGSLRSYWDGRDWVRGFLASAGARQGSLELGGRAGAAELESTLHVQKTLLVELEENEHKLSECGDRAKQCVAHIKGYDAKVRSYRTEVAIRVGAPGKRQGEESSGDVLLAEVQELNSGYAGLMGRARSNLEALEGHLLDLETCENDSALSNGEAEDAAADRLRKESVSFAGLRGPVSLWQLELAHVVDAATAQRLAGGSLSVAEASASLGRYLDGRRSVAGLLLEPSGQKLSPYEAVRLGQLKPAAALRLLEAQAATGLLADPDGGAGLTAAEALGRGLVGDEFRRELLSAERAVLGFADAGAPGEILSLFEAMQRGLIARDDGMRLLEAQVATGGVVDPRAGLRLPVDVALERGLVDEETHRALSAAGDAAGGFTDPGTGEPVTYGRLLGRCVADPATGLPLLPLRRKGSKIASDVVISKIEEVERSNTDLVASVPLVSESTLTTNETRYVKVETELSDLLKATTVTVGGRALSLKDIFNGDSVDEETKRRLMEEFRAGRLTLEQLAVMMAEAAAGGRGGGGDDASKGLTFSGLRRELSLEELAKSGVIDGETASRLRDGSRSVEEVSNSISPYLSGTACVAGVLVEATGETLAVYAAMRRGLIRPGTALELLEAQAATGFIVEPASAAKLTVDEAVAAGVVGDEFHDKLLSAERAVTGYLDPYTGGQISLFQAMKRNLVVRDHGVRLLEAQIATGGVIDPQASHRLPVAAAFERGLVDEKTHAILVDPLQDTKGFFDPNTEENLTYRALLARCAPDARTGLLLLPLRERKVSSSVRQRRVLVVDPGTGRRVTVYEAYARGVIDEALYLKFSKQECEWEEISVTGADGASSTLVDKRSGRRFGLDEALASGVIDGAALERYRSGAMSIFELGDRLSASGLASGGPASPAPLSPARDCRAGGAGDPAWADPAEETAPIGGVLDGDTGEVLSAAEAGRRRLVDAATTLALLEAQACTGGVLDPATGLRHPAARAVELGLVDRSAAEKLALADKAFAGFEEPGTGRMVSTALAMRRGWLFPEVAQRLLEAQYLTGGLVRPGAGGRESVAEALASGELDEAAARRLRDAGAHARALLCPKTRARVSYGEALARAITDPATGLRLMEAAGQGARAGGGGVRSTVKTSSSSSSFQSFSRSSQPVPAPRR